MWPESDDCGAPARPAYARALVIALQAQTAAASLMATDSYYVWQPVARGAFGFNTIGSSGHPAGAVLTAWV